MIWVNYSIRDGFVKEEILISWCRTIGSAVERFPDKKVVDNSTPSLPTNSEFLEALAFARLGDSCKAKIFFGCRESFMAHNLRKKNKVNFGL